jgi:hypothetical protein
MKKLVLLSIVILVGFCGFAQKANQKVPYNFKKSMVKQNKMDIDPSVFTPAALPSKTLKKGVTDIAKIPITSSFNIYGGLYAEQTCLTYNKDLNLIMHTSRANPPVIGTNSGDIVTSISEDNGATFTKKIALANGNSHRYPSGVIYNPAGNTVVNDAYSVVAGPRTDGSGWVFEFYSSVKFDGTGINTYYRPNTSGNEFVESDGMTATADGAMHIAAIEYVYTTSGYTGYRGDVAKGVFNSGTNSFEWTAQDIMPDIHVASDGTYDFFNHANLAWSEDGTVGYYFLTAVDNRPDVLGSFAPIIYKTTDAGETWNELDYVDYTNNPVISPYIKPTWDPSITRPFFTETDGVVDANNELHLFARIRGASAIDPDSAGYIWTVGGNAERGAIFEISTQGDQWNVEFIDTLMTSAPLAEQTGYGTGTDAEAWDMMLQASRTTDGTKVFCTWTDTDPVTFGTELNLNPDIWVWGRDLETNMRTIPKNKTELSDAWGECYFSHTAATMKDNIAGVYEFPVSITDIHTTNDPGLPVYHSYVQGITLEDADFVIIGVGNSAKVNPGMTVSQNIPNPFTGTTKIEVNLEKTSDLSLVVYNLTGQKVYELNNGSTPAGMQTLTINGSNLKSGVYFYTVTAGENKITKKMVIK